MYLLHIQTHLNVRVCMAVTALAIRPIRFSRLIYCAPSHHHRMTYDHVDHWVNMCDKLMTEEKKRKAWYCRKGNAHSSSSPDKASLSASTVGWRWEHCNAGQMDDLLRGWERYYFKSFFPPPSEVRGTGGRRLFQRMGNLEAGITAHLKKALGKNQSCAWAVIYERSIGFDPLLRNKCYYMYF